MRYSTACGSESLDLCWGSVFLSEAFSLSWMRSEVRLRPSMERGLQLVPSLALESDLEADSLRMKPIRHISGETEAAAAAINFSREEKLARKTRAPPYHDSASMYFVGSIPVPVSCTVEPSDRFTAWRCRRATRGESSLHW